jgi:hypothetical protein
VTIKEPAKARELYARAVAADPTIRAPEMHLAYVRLLLELREFSAAHSALRSCSRNTSGAIIPVTVEYLKATGHLDSAATEIADLRFSARQWLDLRRAIFSELLGSQKLAAALTLAEENPQIVGDEQSSLLRKNLKEPADFQRAATLLEQVRAQGGDVAGALADLLAAWAEDELTSLQVDSALAHLAKAHDLSPGKWPIVERLAGLYLDRAEPAKAAQALQSFLAISNDSAERHKATQLLTRIPAP